VKFVDLAGKDPKKINDWINFAIDLYNASTAVLSIGFQASANVDVSVAKVGVDANAGSVDLLGVREGVFTPGVNTPQISKGVELNVGVISFSTGITTTDTGISKIKENTISVGVSAFEFYQTETTETNNFTNKSTTTTESGVKAADLKFSASLVFGIELGLNTEKAATALYNLLKTE
jgi:hypothetical protein